ncbi:hypothetical protein EDD18DRAFT_1313037 [Armillaria luteobubalina]|uniref:Uncharacterized protein n=1 Tax=Armillaria luteobubalina TaxID=153913 RepID=A0AA39UBT4_9AGAR|nr:hypothetical protein EDD18DRAFT_1313037 [Armillaria luteobubalina]
MALPLHPRPAALTVEDSERYSLEDIEDWESIVPDSHGFVRLDDTFYVVSMYHQMHCLMSFQHLVMTPANNGTMSSHAIMHAKHCLSYLRQMVLCQADITLEETFPEDARGLWSWGITHECHDWTEVREFATNNYVGWMEEDKDYVATIGDKKPE